MAMYSDPTIHCVYVESPYSSDTSEGRNDRIEYARKAMQDCLKRHEAPFVSHLLYTQVPYRGFVADSDNLNQCVGRDIAIKLED